MLTIAIGGIEHYDEDKNLFYVTGGTELQFEHSLVSLSKWEQKFEKPFLSDKKKTTEETLEYIKVMCLTEDVPQELWDKISQKNVDDINAYIDSKMTATWFTDVGAKAANDETITNELIYYWMSSFQIPWEAQHWHLNRLFTLIKIFGAKTGKPKQMSKNEILARNRELNARRRAESGSKG